THDFGGAFGMAWAVQHPNKVRRIVVINQPFFIADYHWHLWARLWRTPILGEFNLLTLNWLAFYPLVRYGSRPISRDSLRLMYGFSTPLGKPTVLRLYRAANPAAFRDWEPRKRRVTAHFSTLVLWGTQDPWIPIWVADSFGAEKVVHFPDAGHWTPAEVPDR